MKRWEKISLVIILICISGIVFLGIWQSDNIKAGFMFLTKSTEQIAAEMDENKRQFEEDLQKKYSTIISDFTAEEERKIIEGELSVEEALEMLKEKYSNKIDESDVEGVVNESTSVSSSLNSSEKAGNDRIGNTSSVDIKVTENGEIKVTNSSGNQSDVDAIVGNKIVQLYSLKAYYLGRLGQLEAEVKRDYFNLPKTERNLVGKKNLANKYMGKALGYMEKCDSQVEKILTELEKDLKRIKADTSVINNIRTAYENEKTMKKAYYVKLLEE